MMSGNAAEFLFRLTGVSAEIFHEEFLLDPDGHGRDKALQTAGNKE
jgi:hypothetical protein